MKPTYSTSELTKILKEAGHEKLPKYKLGKGYRIIKSGHERNIVTVDLVGFGDMTKRCDEMTNLIIKNGFKIRAKGRSIIRVKLNPTNC